MTNPCGTCTACCRVFAIGELKKPAGKWCDNCAIGKGCKVYADRPQTCIDYECRWLSSQRVKGEEFPPELRPDKCKVVFHVNSANANVMLATTMPDMPQAWKRPSVIKVIQRLLRTNVAVAVGTSGADHRTMFCPDGRVVKQHLTEPDENGVQHHLQWEEAPNEAARL